MVSLGPFDWTSTLVPGQQLGRYRVLRRIGGGGQSSVYAAVDDGDEVAVKVIDSWPSLAQNLEQARQEAFLHRRLAHPRIVRCRHFGQDRQHCYLVTDLAAGGDSRRLLSGGAVLSEERIVALMADCALGLSALHGRGYLHLDVKPANVLLDDDGRALLADLGSARRLGPMHDRLLGGAPGFMAPEQIEDRRCERWTDLYGLGACGYYWSTGAIPYAAEGALQTLRQTIEAPEADVRILRPDLDPALARCIARSMRREPRYRYRDVDELLADLGVGRRRAAGRSRPRSRPQLGPRLGILSLSAALLVAAGLTLGAWIGQRDGDQRGENVSEARLAP